jgi:hypothetical protein
MRSVSVRKITSVVDMKRRYSPSSTSVDIPRFVVLHFALNDVSDWLVVSLRTPYELLR